jgi:hypothetical protein
VNDHPLPGPNALSKTASSIFPSGTEAAGAFGFCPAGMAAAAAILMIRLIEKVERHSQ